jgi:hypothetical protein
VKLFLKQLIQVSTTGRLDYVGDNLPLIQLFIWRRGVKLRIRLGDDRSLRFIVCPDIPGKKIRLDFLARVA